MLLKKLPYYFIFLFIVYSCSAQKSSNTDVVIVLETKTRGVSNNIKITNSKGVYKTLSQEIVFSLSNEEKERINIIITDLDLSKIAHLEAPSNKRFTDGALAATIQIRLEGENFISSDFDYDNPPKELKILVTFLNDLIP